MKITLELWDDQSGADRIDLDSLHWVLKVNGEDFPDSDCNLAGYKTIHSVVCDLLDVEVKMTEDES